MHLDGMRPLQPPCTDELRKRPLVQAKIGDGPVNKARSCNPGRTVLAFSLPQRVLGKSAALEAQP